ncbi:portal protein [Kaistia granuli]|uniref:portal protein n=1 Tax=Kaistia granuli TaxID=363259 RepID=UPI0003709205|nr:portal protein [Kaistia granuli]
MAGAKADPDFIATALKRYDAGYDRERENIDWAYEDLEIRAGNQWPEYAKKARKDRPTLTVNRIPQFVRQVTGDIRMMRPSIKVVPVDNRGDVKTAEKLSGLVRYIENRSDARSVYTDAADSQVVAGIGHFRIETEYAASTTFDQEIRIASVEDGVAVIWDPNAKRPMRDDAMWCHVPVDMSVEAFKEKYPDASVEDFGKVQNRGEWHGSDTVRVSEYWEKRAEKKTLVLLPDGSIEDVTDDENALARNVEGARVEKRDSFAIYRSLITCAHTLEGPDKWPGAYIPVIPVIGEQVKIGRKIIRHGIVRFAAEAQRMYNYAVSAETEVVALQPKAPFIGTEVNFENNPNEWLSANTDNLPYLTYKPDPVNGGAPPQRSQPPVTSQGLSEMIARTAEEMKAVIGIYDAGLGNRSNETSGKAILARQREGDIGSVVYIDNFNLAVQQAGRIIVDLIPHIYDTERMIRILGEDGKMDPLQINHKVQVQVGKDGMATHPATGQKFPAKPGMRPGDTMNVIGYDVTVGAYDVVMSTGPSYSTRREEAKEGMTAFLQAAPDVAPLVMDLVAKAQDWPNADQFAKRLETALPPQIRAMEAEEGDMAPPPPPQPNPAQMAAAAEAQAKGEQSQIDLQKAQIELQMKEIDLLLKKASLLAPQQPQLQQIGGPQPQDQAAPQGTPPGEVEAALRIVGDQLLEQQQINARQEQMLQELAAVIMGQGAQQPAPMPPQAAEPAFQPAEDIPPAL